MSLNAVRRALGATDGGVQLDRNDSRDSEMSPTEMARQRRGEGIERGITPEAKRSNEIKAGVVTASVGVGVAIFFYVLMEGIIAGGSVGPAAAEILRRTWVLGVIPFCVGVGLVINGLFVSKAPTRPAAQSPQAGPEALRQEPERNSLRSGDIAEFIPPTFSVTDEPTKHLTRSGQKQ